MSSPSDRKEDVEDVIMAITTSTTDLKKDPIAIVRDKIRNCKTFDIEKCLWEMKADITSSDGCSDYDQSWDADVSKDVNLGKLLKDGSIQNPVLDDLYGPYSEEDECLLINAVETLLLLLDGFRSFENWIYINRVPKDYQNNYEVHDWHFQINFSKDAMNMFKLYYSHFIIDVLYGVDDLANIVVSYLAEQFY